MIDHRQIAHRHSHRQKSRPAYGRGRPGENFPLI